MGLQLQRLREATQTTRVTPSLTVFIRILRIGALAAAFSCSWFVPEVIASGDRHEVVGRDAPKEGAGHDNVVESSSTLENDLIDDEGEINGLEEELNEFNPMGLQIWSDGESFLRALNGGRLVLAVIVADWCERGNTDELQHEAALAAEMLDETFLSLSETGDLPPVTKPLIGLIDSIASKDLVESFGTLTHYPALQFVLTYPNGNQKMAGDRGNEEEGDGDDIQIWEFLGPRESAKDLHDSVLMYWYRFVVSDALIEDAEHKPQNIFSFSSHNQMASFIENHGDGLMRPATAHRRRHQSKLESEVFNFLMGLDESNDVGGIFHRYSFIDDSIPSNQQCHNSDQNDDNDATNSEDCNDSNEFTQEVDPYVILVQCRSKMRDYGDIDLKEGSEKMAFSESVQLKMQRRAMDDFDDLAEEMAYRMDVAFFALNATVLNEGATNISSKVCGGLFDGIEGDPNGAVIFLRARRHVTYTMEDDDLWQDDQQEHLNHNIWSRSRKRVIHSVRTDWGVMKGKSHAAFVPATTTDEFPEEHKELFGKHAQKDPLASMDYVKSNLVASTIVHATPTVIWYDKERMASLAFPWYRKVHAVLFVDIGLAHKVIRPSKMSHPTWPSSLNHSAETVQLLLNQRKAIELFYNTALRHRAERPNDDVVFMIVPSSEVRIMTTFGIDLWTPLDEALFNKMHHAGINDDEEIIDQSSHIDNNGYCSTSDDGEKHNILPVMITDSSGRSGMQSSRYYMCWNEILSSSPREFNDGGAIGTFIDKFFNGNIGKPFIRSETKPPTSKTTFEQNSGPNANKPNVTTLTGNTFESLVMDRNDEHTMLLIQAHTCGHCKRFSIFWNELASLVQALNWSSAINVMKIDVTKNDVPHEKINAWDLPSVYYFPAHEKNDPIEMTPLEFLTNPQNDYDEGLSFITSGFDIVNWMVNQGKLDLELLLQLDGSSTNDKESVAQK